MGRAALAKAWGEALRCPSMSFDRLVPWRDPRSGGCAAQPERYALRALVQGHYLGIASNERIEEVEDPQRAWIFHTHDRAVATAREIAATFGQAVDVVKLR